MSSRSCAFLAAIMTLLASGVLYHALAMDSAQLDEAAARVALAPMAVGEWQGHAEATDAATFVQAGAKTYWARVYTHQRTKASVLVILMCGRSGKMAVHTPEICYGGAGFELQNAPRSTDFKTERGDQTSQFWTAHFVKKVGGPKHLRLYWSWNARGDWQAAAAPRWQFRGEPFLYKLYVSHDIAHRPGAAAQSDPAAEFVRSFLPALDGTLFPN